MLWDCHLGSCLGLGCFWKFGRFCVYCVYQSWFFVFWGGVLVVLGLFFFVCLVWSEPKLLNKDNPVALRGREHPLHAAAGSGAGPPCARKFCLGQLGWQGTAWAPEAAPCRAEGTRLWRDGEMLLRRRVKTWGGLWQLELPGLACSHRCFLCALVKAASMSVLAWDSPAVLG